MRVLVYNEQLWGFSLRLEHEEWFVMALEQVEEQYPFRLICNCWSKRLACDDMPARGFVFKLFVTLDLALNFSRKVLVNLSLLCCFLANYLSYERIMSYSIEFNHKNLRLIALSTRGHGISVNLILWGGRGSTWTSWSSSLSWCICLIKF